MNDYLTQQYKKLTKLATNRLVLTRLYEIAKSGHIRKAIIKNFQEKERIKNNIKRIERWHLCEI